MRTCTYLGWSARFARVVGLFYSSVEFVGLFHPSVGCNTGTIRSNEKDWELFCPKEITRLFRSAWDFWELSCPIGDCGTNLSGLYRRGLQELLRPACAGVVVGTIPPGLCWCLVNLPNFECKVNQKCLSEDIAQKSNNETLPDELLDWFWLFAAWITLDRCPNNAEGQNCLFYSL